MYNTGSSGTMNVVICGGGIIGASIAYHLALKGVRCTIVERHQLACAASGKAGGFLARDWCNHHELGPLATKSFDMHMTLAKDERFKDCDYRTTDTLSVRIKEGTSRRNDEGLPEWLDGPILESSPIGDTTTTAQVHPYKLTHAFFKIAQDLVGTECIEGIVEGIQTEGTKVVGVKVNGNILPADATIIAMGPWSGKAMEWFKLPPVTGHRAHSVVLKPRRPISAHACFLDYSGGYGRNRSPEAYPRPDGTVYFCGMGDDEKLPADPKQVQSKAESLSTLRGMAGVLSSSLKECEIVAEQACYLPSSPDGLPLIGRLTDGAYIATGHSCWGILNAPGTGEAVAQLVVNGNCTLVDLSPFDPARLV